MHEGVEMKNLVVLNQLVVYQGACSEKILEQLFIVRFAVKKTIVFMSDLSRYDILLMFFLKLSVVLLIASCSRAHRIWLASIVTSVSSVWECGWLEERTSCAFLMKLQG